MKQDLLNSDSTQAFTPVPVNQTDSSSTGYVVSAYDPGFSAANFLKGSNLLIGSKRRIAGLGLRANDLEWATGSGPEVTGPAISLLMAMTGRAAALDDLSGEGVATLRSRM